MRMCSFKWCLNLNALPHCSHLNLRRSVLSSWLIIWRCSLYTLANVFLQTLHVCDVAECSAMWLSRWDLSMNVSSHFGHMNFNVFSECIVFMCTRRADVRLKDSLQCAHLTTDSSSVLFSESAMNRKKKKVILVKFGINSLAQKQIWVIQKNFFSEFFFHKCKLWIVWNWFIPKIILILQKYLFWGYSKWWQINQCAPGLNRGLLSNLWRPRSANHVIFAEECVMSMKKHIFIKNIYKWAKQSMGWKHTDFPEKKKFWL